MKRLIVGWLFGISTGIALGQTGQDSFLSAGRKAYLEGEYATAIELYRSYYQQALQAGDLSAAADGLRLIGDAFRASEEFEEAIQQLNLGLEKANEARD